MRFLTALKKGKTIRNPEFWKKIQNFINLVFGLSGVIAFKYPEIASQLTTENLAAITIGMSSINGYLSTITTDKVGV